MPRLVLIVVVAWVAVAIGTGILVAFDGDSGSRDMADEHEKEEV